MGRYSAFIALSALLLGTAAQAKNHIEILAPSSPWNLNYGTNSCRLLRVFGTDDNKVAFYIEKYGISPEFTVLVAGKSIRRMIDTEAKIRFSNGGGAGVLTEGTFGPFGPAVFSTNGTLDPKLLARLNDIEDHARSGHESRQSDEDDLPQIVSLTPAELKDITWVQLSFGNHTVRLMTGP